MRRTMRTGRGGTRGALLGAAAAAVILCAAAGEARATGIRVQGALGWAADDSWDVFSTTDRRSGLDLSFSYTVLTLGCAVLLDVEAGYGHFPRSEASLFSFSSGYSYGQSLFRAELLTHAVYGGVRVHLRIDRKKVEWFQPFLRVAGGYLWARAQVAPQAERAATLSDWAGNGFLYVGGGVQLTVPVSFVRERMKICATKRFSVGLSYEVGYYRPWKLSFDLAPAKPEGIEADPIPVEGVSIGSLDLSGLWMQVGLVVAF